MYLSLLKGVVDKQEYKPRQSSVMYHNKFKFRITACGIYLIPGKPAVVPKNSFFKF